MTFVRRLSFFLFCLVAFASGAQTNSADNRLPVITEATVSSLYDDDPAKVRQLVNQREKLLQDLSQQLQQQLPQEQPETPMDEATNQRLNAIQSALDSLNNLHFRHLRLLSELEQKAPVPPEQPKLEPPYELSDIEHVNDYLTQLDQSIATAEAEQADIQKRLDNLQAQLSTLISEYTQARDKTAINPQAIEKLAQIYNYQTEYAILKLKQKRLQKYLQELQSRKKEYQSNLPLLIEDLKVSPEQLQDLKARLQKQEKALQELKTAHAKKNQAINKKILKAEQAMDNIELKLAQTKDPDEIRTLNLDKTLQLTRLKQAQYEKYLLSQKEFASQLQLTNTQFTLDWLQAYLQKSLLPNRLKEVLKDWGERTKALNKKIEANRQLVQSLEQDQLELAASLQNTADVQVNDRTTRRLLSSLRKEIKNTQPVLENLAKTLQENISRGDRILSKINRIADVLKSQLDVLQRARQWLEVHFKSQWQSVKNVLYYPIWSFGGTAFTLAVLFKIIFYITLGIWFLRFLRSRLVHILTRKFNVSEGAAYSIATLVYYAGGLIVLLTSLTWAGFNLNQLVIVLGALGVGIGFGLQTIANNFMSGMILLIDRTLTVGDVIKLQDGTRGKVKKLAMRYTVVRTNAGEDLIVPNSELISSRVTSLTYDDYYLRLEVPFGVSYDSDPKLVKKIGLDVARNVRHTVIDPLHQPNVVFKGFGESSLKFEMRVWIMFPAALRPTATRSDYYYALHEALTEAGIEIPYPQRDLHFRSVDDEVIKKLREEEEEISRQSAGEIASSRETEDDSGNKSPATTDKPSPEQAKKDDPSSRKSS